MPVPIIVIVMFVVLATTLVAVECSSSIERDRRRYGDRVPLGKNGPK